MQYCLNCFKEITEGKKCVSCGFAENREERLPQYLPAEIILKGRYRIGRVLGQGGFGITYKAYDLELLRIVAIKEYYPAEMAQRTQGENTVFAYRQGEIAQLFQHGKEKFLEEARTLAKFSDFPGIVRLYDCFEENGTAYMVMQFLDGIDLDAYLAKKGGRVDCDEAKQILLPVTDALREIHRAGMIHRDISPQNIFITTAGQIKVIDFGAARAAVLGEEKSRSVLLKPGYAPEEQYRTHGRQGSWTDVYALTATLYRMVTGMIPPDALERMHSGEALEIPSGLAPEVRAVLKKGMSIRAEERFFDMAALQEVLYGNKILTEEGSFRGDTVSAGGEDASHSFAAGQTAYTPAEKKKRKGNLLPVVFVIVSVCLIVGMFAFLLYMLFLSPMGQEKLVQKEEIQESVLSESDQPYIAPVFSAVTASAKTTSANTGRSYGAALVCDKKTDTAWNVPGGRGEWIQLAAEAPQKVRGMRILNGYTKYSSDYDMWIYSANSRPRDITVSFSDGTNLTYTLQDIFEAGRYDYQTIDFGGEKQTSFVRITINSVYQGYQWNDCCISEIEVY